MSIDKETKEKILREFKAEYSYYLKHKRDEYCHGIAWRIEKSAIIMGIRPGEIEDIKSKLEMEAIK